MGQIERYRLIEQTALRGPVTVWRAIDSFDADVEVALEIVALANGNDEAIAELRRAAHERARREKNVAVRIFEDLERGVVGVATRRAPRPETRVDMGRAPPAPWASPAPLLTRIDAPPETLRDRPSFPRWLRPTFIAAGIGVSLTMLAALLWRAPWRSEEDTDEEPSTSLLPKRGSETRGSAHETTPTPAPETPPTLAPVTPPSGAPSPAEFDAAGRAAVLVYGDEHACRAATLRGWLRVKCERHTAQGVLVRTSSGVSYPDGWTVLVIPILAHEQRVDFVFSGNPNPLNTLRVFASGSSGPVGEFDGGACNPPAAPLHFACCIDSDGSRRIFKGACADRHRRVAP